MAQDNQEPKRIPIPIHENIVKDGKPTQAFVRYLIKMQTRIQQLEERIEVLEAP